VAKKEEMTRISIDPDYIHSPKHENSLRILLDQNPEGVNDAMICKVLCLTQKELDDIYESAILKLKEGMDRDE